MKVTESKQLPWRRDTVVKWILTVICERKKKLFEQNRFKSEQSSKMNKEVFLFFVWSEKVIHLY